MTAVAVLRLVEQAESISTRRFKLTFLIFPKRNIRLRFASFSIIWAGFRITLIVKRNSTLKNTKPREKRSRFEKFDLVAEPGTKFSYSSYGYNLLGAIIESASKQPYADYMRERIWQPLE